MYYYEQPLLKREKEGNPIKIGIVGMGEMGKGLLNQVHNYTPGMMVLGIFNRNIEKAQQACHTVGIKQFTTEAKPNIFQKAFENNMPVITNDISFLIESEEIDVIIEMTGSISFGLDTIIRSFKSGKHVVSFNAELEATFGSYLKDQAQKHKVKYTLGDGDQPGVTLNLFRHVKLMGFEPLVCGNIKGLQDHYRNPTTQQSFAKTWDMTPEMVTSFADGTKISFEQACIANATNMTIAQKGMIGIHSKEHVDDLTGNFDVDQIRELGGIVDYVVGARPGPGVFIYATTSDPISKKYLKYGKLGDGPLYSFYVPYHLLFFELAFSIARLIDLDDITLDAQYGMKVEVVGLAKRALSRGHTLDGLGGYDSYGVCEKSNLSRSDKLVPMGLLLGCELKNDIEKDQPITLSDLNQNGKEKLFEHYFSQF